MVVTRNREASEAKEVEETNSSMVTHAPRAEASSAQNPENKEVLDAIAAMQKEMVQTMTQLTLAITQVATNGPAQRTSLAHPGEMAESVQAPERPDPVVASQPVINVEAEQESWNEKVPKEVNGQGARGEVENGDKGKQMATAYQPPHKREEIPKALTPPVVKPATHTQGYTGPLTQPTLYEEGAPSIGRNVTFGGSSNFEPAVSGLPLGQSSPLLTQTLYGRNGGQVDANAVREVVQDLLGPGFRPIARPEF